MTRLSKFVEQTIFIEGDFQNDPVDAGNYHNGIIYGTIYGITARDHFDVFTKIYQLWVQGKRTEAKAEAVEFWRNSIYWNTFFDEFIDSSLAFKVWDIGVNMHPKKAKKLLVETIKLYEPDFNSIFYCDIVEACNRLHRERRFLPDEKIISGESEFYTMYVERIKKEYRSFKNFFRFGKGWLKRAGFVFNGAPDLVDKKLPNPEPLGMEYIKK